MILPTSVATYRRSDLPGVRLLNMYAEAAEKVAQNVVLLPRPALTPRTAFAATGAVWGLFHQPGAFGDAVFTATGGRLFSNAADVGSLPASSGVQMTVADNALLATAGATLYRYDGMTLTTPTFPDTASVSSVAFLGGYAFAARAGSRRFYFSADSGATWDGLDYLSAEQSTDYIVGLMVVVDQLWVLCQRHVEIFFLTGDADAPVQRVQGRVFDKGCLARDTIVRLDNSVVWVGHDGIVYRGEAAPLRISDHGVEERIALSGAAEMTAWSYAWRGHLFYVLQLAAETLVYDVATQQWHEAGSYGLPRWRGRVGVQVGRDIVVGDDRDSRLWMLADDVYADDSIQIERLFTILLNDPGFVDMVQMDMSAGDAPNPNADPGVIEMRTSRDDGRTFLEWRQRPLGKQGEYRARIGFNRVGMIDREGMLVQVRITDPRPSRISSVRANDQRGGRSRA